MSRDTASTRRSFVKVGALLAAPLAVAAPAAALADDARKARLARLEDETAIRDLHQAWLRRINTGADATGLFADPRRAGFEGALAERAVRSLAADHTGEPDRIDLAKDGLSAAGRFACVVEVEADIAEDCTLAQMARAQGGGFIRQTDRRLLEADYVKTSGGWAIAKVGLTRGKGG